MLRNGFRASGYGAMAVCTMAALRMGVSDGVDAEWDVVRVL